MTSNRKIGLLGALLAAGLVGAGSIWAQAPGPRGEAPEGAGPMRGFERMHKQLKLNPQQEDLWKKAQGVQREAFRSIRAKAEEDRAKLRVQIDKPGADLKQFAETRDQMRVQRRAQMDGVRTQVRSAWFAVYDSLDAGQKEQVRVAIRDGMDRVARGSRGRRFEHREGGPRREPGMG